MSMMHFSSRRSSRPSRPPRSVTASPEVCAKVLGEYIQFARQRDGRPLEEIAPLAGLTPAEWEEIEGGRAPDCWEYICLIANALHIGRSSMPWLMKLYIDAMKQ